MIAPFPSTVRAEATLAARIDAWLALHPEPVEDQCLNCGRVEPTSNAGLCERCES